MVEGCLDDHDIDRGGSLLDDMDEALASESGLLLEAGPSDLCDMHDPDLDESNRAIRYSHNNYTQRKIYSTEMFLRLGFFSCPLKPLHQQQHSFDASRPVCQTHKEEEQQCDERGLDGPLHQQGHSGTSFFLCLTVYLPHQIRVVDVVLHEANS